MAKAGDVVICSVCGKEFVCSHGLQTICSYECDLEKHRIRARKYKGLSDTLVKKCKYCGKEFTAKGRRIYCNDECRRLATNEKQKEYARKRAEEREKKGGKPLIDKVCKHCGKPFKAQRKSEMYCSAKCSKRARALRYKSIAAKKEPPKPKDFPCGHKDCKYAIGTLGGMCNYFTITGELRRCPNTPDCEKYEKAKGRRRAKAKPIHLGSWQE